MIQIKVYRVWFRDGSAVLIEAISAHDAAQKANIEFKQYVQKVECLSD